MAKSLKEKGAAIDFGSLAELAKPDQETGKTPRTAPGMMAQLTGQAALANQEIARLSSDLVQREEQIQRLNQELQTWDNSVPARFLDPKSVGPSRWANRSEASFQSAAFEALKAEIANAGANVQPIKVRPAGKPGDPIQFEIVFGHRRHRACLELGLPVFAIVESIDDRQLFMAMERENRQRADLSAYEQGQMYKRALDAGLFPSANKMAQEMGVDQSNVSKAIKIAELPEAVVDSFASPLEIQFRTGDAIKKALEQDPDRVLAAASELRKRVPRSPAKDVMTALVGLGTVPNPAAPVVKLAKDGSATIKLPAGSLDKAGVEAIDRLIKDFLAARYRT